MDRVNHSQASPGVIHTFITLSADPYSFGVMYWAVVIVAGFVLVGFCNNAWLRYGNYVDHRRVLSAERRCLLSRVCGCKHRNPGTISQEERRASLGDGQRSAPLVSLSATATTSTTTTPKKLSQTDAQQPGAGTRTAPAQSPAEEQETGDDSANASSTTPRKVLPTSMRRRDRVDLTIAFPHTLAEKPTAAAPAKERGNQPLPELSEKMSFQGSSYTWCDTTPYSTGGATDIFSDNSSVDSTFMTNASSYSPIFSSKQTKSASFSANATANTSGGSSANNNNNSSSTNNNSRCFPVYSKEEQETMLKKREANAEALREARRALKTVEHVEHKGSNLKA